MNRRDFFKKTFLGITTLYIARTINNSLLFASDKVLIILSATKGKLGYKEESTIPTKKCLNCKSYKLVKDLNGVETSECELTAMVKAMKADRVLVNPNAYCNMWSKILEKKTTKST